MRKERGHGHGGIGHGAAPQRIPTPVEEGSARSYLWPKEALSRRSLRSPGVRSEEDFDAPDVLVPVSLLRSTGERLATASRRGTTRLDSPSSINLLSPRNSAWSGGPRSLSRCVSRTFCISGPARGGAAMGKDDGCRSGRHGGEDRKSARLELGGPDAPGVRYLGDYVMGTGARVGARRRRVLELPTL